MASTLVMQPRRSMYPCSVRASPGPSTSAMAPYSVMPYISCIAFCAVVYSAPHLGQTGDVPPPPLGVVSLQKEP